MYRGVSGEMREAANTANSGRPRRRTVMSAAFRRDLQAAGCREQNRVCAEQDQPHGACPQIRGAAFMQRETPPGLAQEQQHEHADRDPDCVQSPAGQRGARKVDTRDCLDKTEHRTRQKGGAKKRNPPLVSGGCWVDDDSALLLLAG